MTSQYARPSTARHRRRLFETARPAVVPRRRWTPRLLPEARTHFSWLEILGTVPGSVLDIEPTAEPAPIARLLTNKAHGSSSIHSLPSVTLNLQLDRDAMPGSCSAPRLHPH